MVTPPTGTCMRMCPDAEARERSREYLIHPLEATNDTCALPARERRVDRNAMVKRYARPAADTNIAEPSTLRPFEVLLSTTGLYWRMANERDLKWRMLTHSFVSDRLRAVRTDMVVQRLRAAQVLQLMRQQLVFFLGTTYMCEQLPSSSRGDYDAKLHQNQIVECLAHFVEALDKCFVLNDASSSNDPFVHYDEQLLAVHVLYLLESHDLNTVLWQLHNFRAQHRLPEHVYKLLCTAIRADAIDYNYARLCRELCPAAHSLLAHVIVTRLLPRVRRQAYCTIARAYQPSIHANAVRRILLFDTDEDACAALTATLMFERNGEQLKIIAKTPPGNSNFDTLSMKCDRICDNNKAQNSDTPVDDTVKALTNVRIDQNNDS